MTNNSTHNGKVQAPSNFNFDAEFVPDEPDYLKDDPFHSPEYVPPVEQPTNGKSAQRPQQKQKASTSIKILSMSDVEALPDVEWLVKDFLLEGTLSQIYGEASAGKTFIVLSIMLAIAYGKPWMGRRVKQGTVLYIYAEGESGLRRRLAAYKRYHKVEDTDHIKFIPHAVDLIEKEGELCGEIDKLPAPPTVLVIDTFSMCAPGVDENKASDVAEWLSVARTIQQKYGSHVMVVHHANKNGDYRGSTAFRGNVDTMLEASPGNKAGVVRLEGKKQKDEDKSRMDMWLKLEPVSLWADKHGDVVTSCVVVASGPEERQEKLSPNQQKLLDALDQHTLLTHSDWMESSQVEKDSFNTALKALVTKNIVVKDGSGKGAKYRRLYKGVD